MDESSLSERELRILEDIERNLAAEDPDIHRRMQPVSSRRKRTRLRFGIVGAIVGFFMLMAFTVNLALGIAGFLLMLGSAVVIVTAARQLASDPSAKPSPVRIAIRRAEGRIRPPKKKDD